MHRVLQPFTPFDQSLVWRVHDAYFSSRGMDAWTLGEVPFYATSNYVSATQHARFLVDLVRSRQEKGELAPDAEVWVVEVGSGPGRFAINLFRALERSAGPGGRDLRERLRYVLTDYSEKNVREALGTEALAKLHAAGRIVPARYDLRKPAEIWGLDGEPFAPPPTTAVIANYVCCVLPVKALQWRGPEDGWHEQFIQLTAEVPDELGKRAPGKILDALLADPVKNDLLGRTIQLEHQWRPRSLDAIYGGTVHAEVLTRFVAQIPAASFGYCHGFLDFLDGAASFLAPGGAVLVSDYGSIDGLSIRGLLELRPQIYGNSVAHGIHFPVIRAWADVRGWHTLGSKDTIGTVHTLALRPGRPWDDAERAAFDDSWVRWRGTDDVLDWATAGRMCIDNKEYDRAVRFYRRCLTLEPESPEYYHKAGHAAVEARRLDMAIGLLERGLQMSGPDTRLYDFEFQLGRAHSLRSDFATAIVWYERALEKQGADTTTLTNLASNYEAVGRREDACRAWFKAIELDPRDLRARAGLLDLRDDWWRQHLSKLVGREVADPLIEEVEVPGLTDKPKA